VVNFQDHHPGLVLRPDGSHTRDDPNDYVDGCHRVRIHHPIIF
jgi:hypothetical protein